VTDAKRREINARLHEIAKRSGGDLLTADVIADARDPASPLHDSFAWDVQQAAYSHWTATAARLINGYRVDVTIEGRQLSAPVFVRSPDQPKRYVPTDRLAEEKELARAALRREIERVRAAVGRMRAVAAALGLVDEIVQLEASVSAVGEAVAE
jgi:hypothetical protein